MVLSVLGACPAQSPLSQLQDVLFERAHETPIRQPASQQQKGPHGGPSGVVEPVCAAGEAWGQTAGWVCVTESPGRGLLSAPCQPAGLGENTSRPLFMLLKWSS